MLKTDEARGAGKRTRASGVVTAPANALEIAQPSRVVHRVAVRYGLGIELAAVVAALAGLGSQEART